MLIYLQAIDSAGERMRFEALYTAYRGLMFHVANRILQNTQDAEDAVHMAFLSLAAGEMLETEKGAQVPKVLLDRLGKPWWHAGDVRYDFQLVVRIDENGKKAGVASGTELDVGGGVSVLNGINTAPELTEEERLLTPVEPEYGVTGQKRMQTPAGKRGCLHSFLDKNFVAFLKDSCFIVSGKG